jgi:hypothetical protein
MINNDKGKEIHTLVSVCFSEVQVFEIDDIESKLAKLNNDLSKNYSYFEIIISVSNNFEEYKKILLNISNLRIITVNKKTNQYEQRVILANEALGDIVLLSAFDELNFFDIYKFIEISNLDKKIVIGRHENISNIEIMAKFFFNILGKFSGYKVDLLNAKTISFPRTLLNKILNSQDLELALRFLPRDNELESVTVNGSSSSNRNKKDFRSRLSLSHKLLINIAPKVLNLASFLSGIALLLSFSYVLYVFFVWLMLDYVEPGWVSLSLVVSITSIFLNSAIFGIVIGIQNISNLLSKGDIYNVVNEFNSSDIFKDVKGELNVEIEVKK